MDLTLNEIQTMLQSSAREFMEDQVPKTRVLEIDDSESGFDPSLWEQMSELGWPSLAIPEEYGGLGQGWVDLGVVSEVMGYYRLPQSPAVIGCIVGAGYPGRRLRRPEAGNASRYRNGTADLRACLHRA